jgi:hypothetical protein
MKVIEQFTERRDGRWVTGRREVEMPGVITAEEAERNPPESVRAWQRAELKAQMRDLLIEEALGVDVTERKRELCTAFSALR